ncbi:MAG TPA: hypothetical protein VG709_00675 [Actinomycetota bacterium]|nr:hypothetical protein [Actinomycetota bacterium]
MDQLKKAFYATLGWGDIAAEKSGAWVSRARELATSREETAKSYRQLAMRGERVVKRFSKTPQAERVLGGTKQATRQIKGAYTSVRKALGAEQPRRKAS